MEDIKNLCAVAIEWMDKALDKINPRVTNLGDILDNKMTNECQAWNDGDNVSTYRHS